MHDILLLPVTMMCWGIPGLIGLIATGFWIFMLIDLLQRNFPKNKDNEKIIWILVLLFAQGIGAIIYYFMVKNNSEYN